MGNGYEASGDGWKYRGRGPIQLTGRANYTQFAKEMFEDWESVVNEPDWVSEDKEFALMSAIWFWNKNGLNALADKEDLLTMTKRINGGTNGLDDRVAHYKEAIALLA
jgi:putative chitinase